MGQIKTANCPQCDFKEDYEPCEFGLTYHQSIGTCPNCGIALIDENGNPTREEITFTITDYGKDTLANNA